MVQKPRKKLVKQICARWQIYLLLLLPLVYIGIFAYAPMGGLVLAFKKYNMRAGIWGSPWVGLDNFEFLFMTNDAWIMFRNTLGYNIVFIILGVIIPVAFAIMLNEITKKFVAKAYQTMMFFPYFLSWVVVS